MEITYAIIKDLLVKTEVQRQRVYCQFRLPNTNEVLEADHPIVRTKSTQNRVIETVKRNVLWEARRLAYNTVREVLGPGFLRQTEEQLVNATLRENEFLDTYSEADKRAAIVGAFKKVMHQFVYDPLTQTWRAARHSNLLIKQLHTSPVEHSYDQEILARMLMELAKANATISEEEKHFLQRHLGLSSLKYQELALADPVSSVEAEEVSASAKPTIFQLVYTIALVDQRLGAREKKLLAHYGHSMGLKEAEQIKLATLAKKHVLESIVSLHMPRERLFELADQLEMDRTEAERTYVRFKKRNL